MLPFRLQLDSGVPAYRQVMEQVRQFLAAKLVRPGEQLPSIRELARSLAVNPGTIVKAYAELEHAGVVESRHGRGFFIAEGPPKLTRAERELGVRREAQRFWMAVSEAGLTAERATKLLDDERAAFFPDEEPSGTPHR